MKGTSAMLELLKIVLMAGYAVDYVVMNSWLFNPAQFAAIKNPELDFTEEEIIRIYGKCWQIEVIFKTCKSYLKLISECHSLAYDELIAHVTSAFVRYMLLALEQRKDEDNRILGEIFFFLTDELEDITFGGSFRIIRRAMREGIFAVF